MAAFHLGRCRLRELLKEKGMTQQQLADLAGVTRTQISDWVNDRYKMTLEPALNIAYVLKVDVWNLYELIDSS